MPGWLIPSLANIVVIALVWVLAGDRFLGDERLGPVSTRAQILASGITAVGIVAAATLYLIEKRLAPHFAVELSANTFALRQTSPRTAFVQVAVTITNQGRTEQPIKSIELAMQGIRELTPRAPDQFGDLPTMLLFHRTVSSGKTIGAGETDLQYFEAAVPCHWRLIRAFVKVPQPPYGDPKADGKAPRGVTAQSTAYKKVPVHQRKLIISLDQACDRSAVKGLQ